MSKPGPCLRIKRTIPLFYQPLSRLIDGPVEVDSCLAVGVRLLREMAIGQAVWAIASFLGFFVLEAIEPLANPVGSATIPI